MLTAMPAATTPPDWLMSLLAATGAGSHRTGQFQCPAHTDSSPSLSVGTGRDGRALLHCQAGCEPGEVLTALGLSWRDLRETRAAAPGDHAQNLAVRYPPMEARSGHPATRGMRLEATHDYGQHVLERWRNAKTGAKEMTWFTRDQRGTLIPGLMGTPVADLPLYREREIRMAVAAGETVVVCESESSADALAKQGIYATTWAGGAASPNVDRLVGVLAGGRVVLAPDNDPAGLNCGRSIWRALAPVADLTHVLGQPGQDARDVLTEQGPTAFAREPPELADEQEDPDEDDSADDDGETMNPTEAEAVAAQARLDQAAAASAAAARTIADAWEATPGRKRDLAWASYSPQDRAVITEALDYAAGVDFGEELDAQFADTGRADQDDDTDGISA
jgi:hypothetical protein